MKNDIEFSQEDVRKFWDENPCGGEFVEADEFRSFFKKYDEFKYSIEPHIVDEIAQLKLKGKRLLEIGLGQGAEAQKLIEGGCIYNGVDLTEESVKRVKLRCELYNLPYESVTQQNAENLTFEDNSFDVVFSHGVIHHSPNIKKIIAEIRRVLKPGGQIVIMLYHRNSINYQISIKLIRRLGIFSLFIPGAHKLISRLTGEKSERLMKHVANLKKSGWSYLSMKNFIHRSTDGPDNPYSSVYSKKESLELFKDFSNISFSVHYFNERHFPGFRAILPDSLKNWIERRWGWHLWIKGTK